MGSSRHLAAALVSLGLAFLCLERIHAQVRITEVTLSTRTVELTNFGGASVDLSSWFFCHRFNYVSPGGNIGPGQSRQFVISGLNQVSSDLGIYNSGSFGSATAMQDFVQWGGGGIGRESVAVSKGIWTSGFFLTVPAAGLSLHAKELKTSGLRTGNWFAARPHAGFPVPNPAIDAAVLAGGQWTVDISSHFLAHQAQRNDSTSPPWQPAGGSIQDLGGGKFRLVFPSVAGAREFVRVAAVF